MRVRRARAEKVQNKRLNGQKKWVLNFRERIQIKQVCAAGKG